jgi:hypothetical protein
VNRHFSRVSFPMIGNLASIVQFFQQISQQQKNGFKLLELDSFHGFIYTVPPTHTHALYKDSRKHNSIEGGINHIGREGFLFHPIRAPDSILEAIGASALL